MTELTPEQLALIRTQAAKLAKVQELRDAIEAFMRSPQKEDDKARAWEFGNCIAYIKNGLDAILEGDKT